MEFLSAINLEQLGTAGLFIAYLVYKNARLETEVTNANARTFEVLKEANANALESSRTLDKVISTLRPANV